jgi:hypothetical protein
MSQALNPNMIPASHRGDLRTAHGAAYQAYQLLHVAFIVAPIVAGLDKFFDKLVNWDMYVAPFAEHILRGHVHGFMMFVGVVEIIAGIGAAIRPRIFAYVVALWLICIIINLLLCRTFYDIALRDLGLCLSAFALARLARDFDHPHAPANT